MMAQHHYSFPVLTGIDPGDPLASRKARMAVYQRLVAELDANNQHLSEQISEIDLTDPEDARVLMPEQGADILAHFGEDRFLERYQRYKAHIAEWRQQYPKLAAVDLRYDQQVVLEMTHGTNAVAATPGDQAASTTDPGKPAAEEPAKDGPAKPKPGQSADATAAGTAPDKPAQPKPAAQIKNAAANGKPAGHSSSKPQTAAEKAAAIRALTAKDKAAKAAREKKKRADAQRAALNASRHKPAPTTHRPAAAAEGQ